MNQRFEELLQKTIHNDPKPDVLRRIRQKYACRLLAVKDAEDARALYEAAKDEAGASTRQQLATQHGIFLGGPLFPR